MSTYSIITEVLLRTLRSGSIPWIKPWNEAANPACNYVSGKPYSLFNRLLLSRSGEYMTRQQMLSLGGSFAPSGLSEEDLDGWAAGRYSPRQMADWWSGLSFQEKDQYYQGKNLGEIVTFAKMVEKEVEDENDGQHSFRYPILRFYDVYHVSNMVGIPPRVPEQLPLGVLPDIDAVIGSYLDRTGVRLVVSSNPGYDPSTDTVSIPPRSAFRSDGDYYSVLFHCLVHSTGRAGRLDRQVNRESFVFGQQSPREDLLAEIGSALICTTLLLDTDELFANQAAFIRNFIGWLENDDHMAVWAAGRAEKAANLILYGRQDISEPSLS